MQRYVGRSITNANIAAIAIDTPEKEKYDDESAI
jgi:hypothetical protein